MCCMCLPLRLPAPSVRRAVTEQVLESFATQYGEAQAQALRRYAAADFDTTMRLEDWPE